MSFRVLLRTLLAAAIGFGIGLAAQAKGFATPSPALAKIETPAR